MPLSVCRISVDELIDLRHAVLREGLPRETAIFEGDSNPEARHYGVIDAGRLVACVTLHRSRWQDEPAWQLRGMAVAPGYQSRGIGREMIQFIERELIDDSVRLLWCNARVPAAGFYQKMGWQIVSDIFEIPTAGPHYRMFKRLIHPD